MRDAYRVVDKYLSRYAECSAAWMAEPSVRAVAEACALKSAVVVPVFSESHEDVQRLFSRLTTQLAHLVVLVINQPTYASPQQRSCNARLLEQLRAGSQWGNSSAFWVRDATRYPCTLLVLDATTGELQMRPKEGVGRARKIGFDAVLGLFRAGLLQVPMVGSCDADAILPSEYFDTLAQSPANTSALLFPYSHLPSGDAVVDTQMAQLEASFRYYVLGLAFAGSPYAYHSLGSALAVDLMSYAQVRGVPNRQAGEDFYLLSKLGQLAALQRLNSPCIDITTRVSARVPFGTGPALSQALGETGPLTYDPRCFLALRELLLMWSRSAWHGSWQSSDAPEWLQSDAQKQWQQLEPLLRSCPTGAHRLRRLHEKVDALTTLQIIHRLTQLHFPKRSVAEALFDAGLWEQPRLEGVHDHQKMLRRLEHIEATLPSALGPRLLSGFAPMEVLQEPEHPALMPRCALPERLPA